ncbi:MAG: hypothetical protein HUU55_18970 [Myxococcales bacterium]|nr:hypothetical protein [Myxococcales bacterium]
MNAKSVIVVTFFCLFAGSACGDDGGSIESDTSGNPEWTPDLSSADTTHEDVGTPVPSVTVTAQPLTVPNGKGGTIYGRKYVPEGCDSANPCPAVVLVPDELMAGDEFFGDDVPKLLASEAKLIVVRFNPPGRGIGSEKSDGIEDYNGITTQDALSDVINSLDKNSDTSDRIGVISFGYGLSMAAGALGRFQANKLEEVDFLIDVEGPVNRCFVTSAPFDPDAGVDGDGPGVSNSRCGFEIGPREVAFPVEIDPAPPVLICHEKAFPIGLTQKNCTDDAWWIDREPWNQIKKMKGAYLRLQMKYDHWQASRWHALEAIYLAIQSGGKIKYHQLNDVVSNKPLHVTGDAACLESGCFLDFEGLGNAIEFRRCSGTVCTPYSNPYNASMPDYKPMSLEHFAAKILPNYVKRMVTLDQ